MTSYQLACGHWESLFASDRYSIGAHMPCTQCGLLRVPVIGCAGPWT